MRLYFKLMYWNKRPDLRRDCDCNLIISIHPAFLRNKRPDLRRDCDAISSCLMSWINNRKQTTWFTKGLRPILSLFCAPAGRIWNKRPDLRRDCDANKCSSFMFLQNETNDLIYEGIATTVSLSLFFSFYAKQTTWFTKGLRPPTFIFWSMTLKVPETNDLIYEGIATNIMYSFRCLDGETNDLIYEGIATPVREGRFLMCVQAKQTTWFTKGLRL